MPGSTNFLQWNSGAANQETDSVYAADSLRSGGAPTNAILPSATANKAFYQWSIWVAAMANMMANKGYSPNDGSASPGTALATLESVMANFMLQSDMAPFALLASPIFTGLPEAPTPPTGNDSTRIATTAFVYTALTGLFGTRLKTTLGGSVGVNADNPTNVLSFSVNFPPGSGLYCVDIRYGLWATVGGNVVTAYVLDSTNTLKFAPSGQDATGSGYVCLAGSEITQQTYAGGTTVDFELIVTSNANITVTRDSSLLPSTGAYTFLELTLIQVG